MTNQPQRQKGGRLPQITLAVMQRVTGRLLMGLPLALALSLEDDPTLNEGSWKLAIQRHPQYVTPLAAANAGCLDKCLKRLAESGDCRHLMWVLENRFPAEFAAPQST